MYYDRFKTLESEVKEDTIKMVDMMGGSITLAVYSPETGWPIPDMVRFTDYDEDVEMEMTYYVRRIYNSPIGLRVQCIDDDYEDRDFFLNLLSLGERSLLLDTILKKYLENTPNDGPVFNEPADQWDELI